MKNEKGQVAIVGLFVGCVMLLAVVIVSVWATKVFVARSEAQTAADASALAGVMAGEAAARDAAASNHAVLRRFEQKSDGVVVGVEFAGQYADAKAALAGG